MDSWRESLGFPLPEMVYAENTLVLWHQPTGICIEFDAKSCLEGVVHVEQAEQIQVPAAVTWKKQARCVCFVLFFPPILTDLSRLATDTTLLRWLRVTATGLSTQASTERRSALTRA